MLPTGQEPDVLTSAMLAQRPGAILAITGIKPYARRPDRAAVKVSGKTVASLSIKLITDLGLTVGVCWDDALAARVADAVRYDKALSVAMTRLNRRAMSTKQLMQKLDRLGHDESVVVRVIDRLTELGVLDDEALGGALIRAANTRRPAGPRLLRAKLYQRGIPQATVDRLITAADADPSHTTARALELARKKQRTLDAKLHPATRARRLWGLLARRSFEPETIREALQQLDVSAASQGDTL